LQLSVIILSYNVRYFLELSVLSVQSALEHIEGEIIVVDNNSQDDSCEMMKQRFPNVKLIENKDNSVFRKGIIQVSLSPKENTFASSILIPWLPKILLQSTGFRRKQDLGIVGVKLIDGAGGFFLKVRGVPTPFALQK
jgi:glycosyltransferase involved in cell wall biosynthesis